MGQIRKDEQRRLIAEGDEKAAKSLKGSRYILTSIDEAEVLNLYCCNKGSWIEPIKPVSVPSGSRVYLKASMRYEHLRFSYSLNEQDWQELGPSFDSSILSDEYLEPMHFTGAFIALCVQDLAGREFVADFDYFSYEDPEHV